MAVSSRTTWDTDGKVVRVITKAANSEYSNVIPVPLFIELVEKTIDLINKNGATKTSDVANEKVDVIISQSKYKKSPRTPVYTIFKMLMKEELLKNKDGKSHRYTYGKDEQALRQFLDSKIR